MFKACHIGLGLLLAWCGASQAAETCKLSRLMKFDMTTLDSRRVTIPMTVDGQPQRMLVDTGGLLTALRDGTVDALKLPRKTISNSAIEAFGNRHVNGYALAKNIALGSWKIPSLEVLTLPDDHTSDGADGLLAPDILHLFDLDFDFGASQLSFFSPDHCEGKVVYWTKDGFSRLDVTLDAMNHITTMVDLDGQVIRALIDTGASTTVMSLEQAQRLLRIDVKNAIKSAEPGGKGQVYLYPFKKLVIQGVTVDNPKIVLIPNDVAGLFNNGNARGAPQIILGMNILNKLHLYVAYREKALYVTPANAN
jgi:predicted aspartyl protease